MPTVPHCDKDHPMRAIVTFKFADDKGETWVLWYCERCDFAMALPAQPTS